MLRVSRYFYGNYSPDFTSYTVCVNATLTDPYILGGEQRAFPVYMKTILSITMIPGGHMAGLALHN